MPTLVAGIFENFDLLSYVCKLSHPSDQARLLRVSKLSFNAAVSVVWENVRGVQHLIALSPGVKCTILAQDTGYKEISIRPGSINLERFGLYAPFVKCLEIYSIGTMGYVIPNWSEFMKHARDKPLLPNLKYLTLTATYPHIYQLMWIRSFLSPSLVEIRVIPAHPRTPFISYLEASTLLRYITEFCPILQDLSLFPDSEVPSDHKNALQNPQAMINFWDGTLPRYLGRAQSLRRLTTTDVALTPETLGQLGILPHLERLSIFGAVGALTVHERVAEDSFPTLHTFSLRLASDALFVDIMRLGFFKRLTSLNLYFSTRPASNGDAWSWADRLISDICHNSPSLGSLLINFDHDRWYDEHLAIGSEYFLHPMKKLPLREISLRAATLAPQGRARAKIHNLLPTVWGQLTKLHLPDEKASPLELYWFSRLPNLTDLTLHLDLSVPSRDVPRADRPANRCLKNLSSSHRVKVTGDMAQIARWLLFLWPTIQKVDWGDQGDHEIESTRSLFEVLASGLNSMLSLLREVNETRP